MTNFKERPDAEPKITVMPQAIPVVLIESIALQKMFTYTENCKDEVGWLGTATQDHSVITISDVFLFEQEVHATTTEITPEGLSAFGEEILQRPDGVEIWNNLKVWGHSHVNMGITPSGQDDKQMEEFKSIGHDWFIRLICNKKGELSVDVYMYETGLIFKDVPWERIATEQEDEMYGVIYQLQAKIDEIKKASLLEMKAPITEEMRKKVKKKAYNNPYAHKLGTHTSHNYKTNILGDPNYATAFGRWVSGKWRTWHQEAPTETEVFKHGDIIPDEYIINYIDDPDAPLETDLINDDDDVLNFIAVADLDSLAYLTGLDDVEEELIMLGYENLFSSNDLETIYRVALKYNMQNEAFEGADWNGYY